MPVWGGRGFEPCPYFLLKKLKIFFLRMQKQKAVHKAAISRLCSIWNGRTYDGHPVAALAVEHPNDDGLDSGWTRSTRRSTRLLKLVLNAYGMTSRYGQCWKRSGSSPATRTGAITSCRFWSAVRRRVNTAAKGQFRRLPQSASFVCSTAERRHRESSIRRWSITEAIWNAWCSPSATLRLMKACPQPAPRKSSGALTGVDMSSGQKPTAQSMSYSCIQTSGWPACNRPGKRRRRRQLMIKEWTRSSATVSSMAKSVAWSSRAGTTVDFIFLRKTLFDFIKSCGGRIGLKFSGVALLGLLYSPKWKRSFFSNGKVPFSTAGSSLRAVQESCSVKEIYRWKEDRFVFFMKKM